MQILAERYEIVRSLTKGGMGAVYEARDRQRGGSICAVKEMLENLNESDNAEIFRRRFIEESALLKRLDHPGIPKARDSFASGESLYIVMDFVEGANLEQELSAARSLSGHPMPAATVVDVAVQILDVLIYLHELQPPVVHRDVKPANAIRDFKTGRIKLVDFGMARAVSLERNSLQTMVGTLVYCSLEQMQGHAEPRSDLYSLGVSMFELLTGQTPAFLKVPLISTVAPDLDPELAAVVGRATRVPLTERIASAREMREALEPCWARLKSPKVEAPLESEPVVVPVQQPERPASPPPLMVAPRSLGLIGMALGVFLGGGSPNAEPTPRRVGYRTPARHSLPAKFDLPVRAAPTGEAEGLTTRPGADSQGEPVSPIVPTPAIETPSREDIQAPGLP
jgi:serine/threonine protein kinase